jgi:hypothetical protein
MRDDVENERLYTEIKKLDAERKEAANDRSNQDQRDVQQAQEEWNEMTSVAEPDADQTTVDVNRSRLSKHIADLFTEKYAINPLQPAGQLVKTWMMLHDEIQEIIKTLEERSVTLEGEVAQEKLNEPEERHWTA